METQAEIAAHERIMLSSFGPQMVRPEAHGEQILQKNYLIQAIAFTQNNPESFRITEFPQNLPAHSAGGADPAQDSVISPDHGNRLKRADAFAHCFTKSSPLGAASAGKSCIFNVAAGIYFTVRGQKGRSYSKPGIRTI
jgi:hypothetical protein